MCLCRWEFSGLLLVIKDWSCKSTVPCGPLKAWGQHRVEHLIIGALPSRGVTASGMAGHIPLTHWLPVCHLVVATAHACHRRGCDELKSQMWCVPNWVQNQSGSANRRWQGKAFCSTPSALALSPLPDSHHMLPAPCELDDTIHSAFHGFTELFWGEESFLRDENLF